MARTLVISDLHLGSRQGRDVLRRPAVLEALTSALSDVDRLVLLGDTIELLEARNRKAMAGARPVLEALGAALGRDGEVVVVAGNHDQALVRPWLRERRASDRPIGLAARVPRGSHPWLTEIADWLRPARVSFRYPGVWLGDGIWATHGHYLDRHLLWPYGQSPEQRWRAEDYEITTDGPLARLLEFTLPSVVTEPLDLAVGLGHRAAAVSVPAVAWLTRGALAPLSAGALGYQFRYAGLPAFTQVLDRLEVRARHVIFGHLHHAGQWTIGKRVLLNTGTWVYEPLLLAGAWPPHPYWPGAAVLVEPGSAPRPVNLLNEFDRRSLTFSPRPRPPSRRRWAAHPPARSQ